MESGHITHGESLWERLDVLRDAGSHGAKTCSVMALFLKERAALENAYGEALIKASKRATRGVQPGGSTWGHSAPALVWAPSLMQEGWAGVVASINSWGKQHVGWAHCIDQNIVKSLTEFSERHKGHVARLWAEAQELVSDMEVVQGEYYRAKDTYEQACIQATRLIDDRNKAKESAASVTRAAAEGAPEAAIGNVHPPFSPSSPSRTKEASGGSMLSSLSNMLEKVGEGVAMAVSKAAGDLSLEELEEKVPEALQRVDVAESEYIASIMAVNGYTTEFQPEMEAKLKQFKLLEESRIMHVRDALLRLDQANKGMLECLLGPGGTLEALSVGLSRVNGAQDAWAQVLFVRELAGMPPLPGPGAEDKNFSSRSEDSFGGEIDRPSGKGEGTHETLGKCTKDEIQRKNGPAMTEGVWGNDEREFLEIAEARERTGEEILELPESGLEKAFDGSRQGTTEAVRVVQEICCCLGEVVSVEESHTRDVLRFLERQGYGSRVAQAGVGGNRVTIDLHVIGATMEDVGKNVMANMSNTSTMATAMSGQGKTLTSGWDASAVNRVLVCVEAHTHLAHALADGSCAAALKVHNEVKATLRRFNKLFTVGSKQLVAARTAHAKASSRYDKITREVAEKEESLTKARNDLKAEVQASAGASIVPEPPLPSPSRRSPSPSPSPPPPLAPSVATSITAGGPNLPSEGSRTDAQQQSRSSAPSSDTTCHVSKRGRATSDHTADTVVLSAAGATVVRRDGPWVLESLGLGQQPAAARVRTLEVKLAVLIQERDAAKQAVQEAVQTMETALVELRRTVQDITLVCFKEDSGRQQSLREILAGVLSALLKSAEALASEQARADTSKIVEQIDGRADVEELVERSVHRATGTGGGGTTPRGRGDGIGEVMFMAYHSEVLQRERDLRKRSALSPHSTQSTQDGVREDNQEGGLRQAGGGGHPLFTAMAEAALAQAHAKQQWRQMSVAAEATATTASKGEATATTTGRVYGSRTRVPIEGPVDVMSLTDGEDILPSSSATARARYRRRYRHANRATEISNRDCLSDSELLMYDDNVSSKRHGGGSFHGVLRRGSRHGGSSHGSRHGGSSHGSRHGRQYSRQGSSKSMRNGGSKHGRSRKQRQQSQQKSSNDLPPLGRGNIHTNYEGKPEAHDNTDDSNGSFSGGGTHGSARTRTKAERGRSLLSLSISPGGVRAMKAIDGVKSEGNGRIVPITGEGSRSGVARFSKADAVHSSRKAAARDGYFHGETKAEREADASKEVRLEVQQDKSPGEGAGEDIEKAGGHDAAGCPSGMKMASTARMGGERHEVGESTLAPTEDFIAPTEESMAPTEEPAAPTEESMAPTEEEGPTTKGKTSGIGIAPAEESSIGIPIARETRRPSLRSLKNRLNQQEHLNLDFSSNDEDDLEVEDASSSDDEQVSQPARSPARSSSDSTGASSFYRYGDFSLSTRKLPAAKQASDELSSLMAFDLPEEALQDKVIESYSSALYTGGGLPLHGRLYVTKKYALFSGWRNTKVVLPLSEVLRVEKTSTLMMVINALTLVKRDGERINFGAFLYRDDCYNLLTRLVKVSSSISRLRGTSDDADGTLTDASAVPRSDSDDGMENGDVSSEPSETARGVAIERSVASPLSHSGGKQFETLVEAVLPCTVAQVFSWLWGRDTTFWSDFLRAQGETGLSISRWCKSYQSTAEGSDGDGRGLKDLFPGETFHGQRQLTFTHSRTGFVVGPRQVLTRQSQGYRLERRQNRPESTLSPPVDRLVLCQTTQMERGAPLADHFTILGKLIVTREPPSRDGQPRCRLEIGFDVAFHKATMLRGAIRSGALEETNATWRAWLATSRKVIAYQRHHLGGTAANNGVASAPPEGVHDLAQGCTLVDISDAMGPGQGKVDEESLAARGMKSTKERKMDGSGFYSFVSGVTRAIRVLGVYAVKTVDSFGVAAVPTLVVCVLFLLMLGLQQRDLHKLKDQVEELVGMVRELRDRIDEGRE